MNESTQRKAVVGASLVGIMGLAGFIALNTGSASTDVGHAFTAHGYTTTIAPGDAYFDPMKHEIVHGTLYPDDHTICMGPCPVGGGRYGWPAHTKGWMMGPEGTSRDEVQTALDKGCYPLSVLGLPAGYKVTDEDYRDVLAVDAHNGSSVYNQIAPCARAGSGPVPTPVPSPSVGPSPAPTTSTPPPSCLDGQCRPECPGNCPVATPVPSPAPTPSPTATPAPTASPGPSPGPSPSPSPSPSPTCVTLSRAPSACGMLDVIAAQPIGRRILIDKVRHNNAVTCSAWQKKDNAAHVALAGGTPLCPR